METKTKVYNKGFTLIELMVTIAIIGLLSSIILVAVGQVRSRSRDTRRKADFRQMMTAVELFMADNNSVAPGVVGYFSNVANLAAFSSQVAPYINRLPSGNPLV